MPGRRTSSTDRPTIVPLEALFRCKGNVYLGLIEHVEKHVPGGLAQVLRGVDDPDLAAFASQRFLAASWYDALPIPTLGEIAARAAGVAYPELMIAFGTAQAERDIRGIYQYLLRFASPAMVVERLPRAARQYFNFVTSELLTRPARSPSELGVGGIPRAFAPAYVLVTEPFLRRALTLAGAKSVNVESSPFESDAPVQGVPTVKFVRRIHWG
jgi:hypothetical protein